MISDREKLNQLYERQKVHNLKPKEQWDLYDVNLQKRLEKEIKALKRKLKLKGDAT